MSITALIIMDGFGIRDESEGNAIKNEGTPNLKKLIAEYPHTTIGASGLDVGLPDGQMGNSEVGHMNIGAGRIVYQELTRITKSIEDGDFFQKKEFLDAIENVKKHDSALHLIGLVSDGGVHSHNTHLYALLKLAKDHGIGDRTYVHCLLDGRDVPPDSGIEYIKQLEEKIKEIGAGQIATVQGRYYGMDRDNRWEREKLAYDCIVKGEGLNAPSAVKAVEDSYEKGDYDEFVIPTVITKNGEPVGKIKKNDSVIFFNFRPDRARELTRSLIEEDFNEFDRGEYQPVMMVSMTQYNKDFKNIEVAFKPEVLKETLGEYLAENHKKQFRIAETEKYAHVTFFFNGGVEKPNEGEDRFLIPSPKVATYDLQPEMSAPEVTKKAEELILSKEYDVMILNFANCDMVGHTGVYDAAVKAVDTVDKCVYQLVQDILKVGGSAIVTADHGNADVMVDKDGGPFTAHSTNPVPCILVSEKYKDAKLRSGGRLSDLAPTMLQLMGLPQPVEMTGQSLIES
ncbi:MAG: 2,3-bisphosphoglycerate-independent phosphoglycerate mutase [Clostridia bacterium]|nr:2,3-bisphosphoglycerate-independent phosphoglycerate mutase [Clostridia bacterium]